MVASSLSLFRLNSREHPSISMFVFMLYGGKFGCTFTPYAFPLLCPRSTIFGYSCNQDLGPVLDLSRESLHNFFFLSSTFYVDSSLEKLIIYDSLY